MKPAPPPDRPDGNHAGEPTSAGSATVPPTVNRDEPAPAAAASTSALATQSATPSAAPLDEPDASALPTRGDLPHAAAGAVDRARGPNQRRDPERYQILGEHGRGGLGSVSRAHDLDLDRHIAIKELISRGHASEARFIREALITARLEHPGIVPIHEAGRWPDGTPFYAMKLVSGRPLRDLIAERTTVAERLGLLHHAIAVADAIAYAHGRNIIHRDLKPANVIVGDFGETIVIDWGLAKDLTTPDEPTIEAGPYRAHHDEGLTRTGAVLGTPVYMPPEQARGEHVDQRADVFAIGAMLWELCSLQKVPPTDHRLRHHLLRRSGIDPDLITIIDKALDPDAAHRYPDAGALAADLKAFKSGARIAARSYSLPALLAHWTRRHRMLAVSATVVAALAATGIVVYVQNISLERDRADAALLRTEAAKNDLALEHAELLLHNDPTAAFAVLSSYRGGDALRRQRLLAEAVGLGVARRRLQPHTDALWFLLGDKDGRIISVGEDGRLKITRGDTSDLLAADVSLDVRVAYAPSVDMLAYAAISPTGVALVRLRDRTITRIDTASSATPQFSTDGSYLAILSDSGELIVLSVHSLNPSEILRTRLSAGTSVRFMTPTRLLTQAPGQLGIIALDSRRRESDVFRVADSSIVTADARPDAVVIGKADGTVMLLSASLHMVKSMPVCRVRVDSVQFVPNRSQVAFCCHDGYSGLIRFDPALTTMTVQNVFSTHGAARVAPDATGQYIAFTDESRTAYLFDNETRLTHRYEGHAARPTYVAPPSKTQPYVLTGDKNGTVRVWDSPTTRASLILQGSIPLYSLVFSNDSRIVLANGYEPPALGIDIGTGSTFQLPGGQLFSTQIAPDASSLLTYGYDGTIRVWRARDLFLTRSFTGHKGLIGEVGYLGPDQIVSAGEDGKLLQWSPQGTDMTELFRCGSPLRRLEILPRNQHVVVYDKSGGVWDIAPDHKVMQVRAPDATAITLLRASRDGKYLAVGTDAGMVTVYDTLSWRQIQTVDTGSNVRQIVFDPQDRDLLVASEASHDQPGGVRVIVLESRRTYRWKNIDVAVRDLSYAPDGDTVGFVTADGGTWLYSMTKDAWNYSNDARTDTYQGKFSPDGRFFATADLHGDVIIHDVAASFHTTDVATTTAEQHN